MALLARRDHSRLELAKKLCAKGYGVEEVAVVLDDLEARGWLSDERFAAAFTESRMARGYGPLRIRAELRQRGVAEGLIDVSLDRRADLLEEIEAVRRKRFGEELPQEPRERARQARFLEQRGFDRDRIRKVLKL